MSPEQVKFFMLLEDYPPLASFWSQEERSLDATGLAKASLNMSHGEKIMASFFSGLWFGKQNGLEFEFDIFEAAATLDSAKRQVIASWLAFPFWP